MTKKDRIAIVISVLYFLVPLGAIATLNVSEGMSLALISMAPLIAYWGYRFIKEDVSFIKSDGKDQA